MHRLPVAAFSAVLLAFLTPTAPAADLAQEYAQVRKIALRDHRVKDAFESANERLDAKIAAIDPSLAAYVRSHPSGADQPAPMAPERHPFRPAATKAPPKPTLAANRRTHTVEAGETLSSIASQYGVSVGKLQSANHIEDARKLRVGQTLAIP
jgi:nucleoid-associated protein YgaU